MSIISSTITNPIRLRVQLIYPQIALFQIGLFLAMIYRGLDYTTPPAEEAQTLSVVEKALSVEVWGAMLIIGGLLGLAGQRWLRLPLAAAAHAVGVAIYAAFAVGLLLSVAQRAHRPPTVFAWTVIAVLAVAVCVTFVVVHWCARHNYFYAWVVLFVALTASLVILANSAGVYGWRTATGWAFVQCIAHYVMADASWDAWRDDRQERNSAEPSQ